MDYRDRFFSKCKQQDKLFISFSGGETSAYMTKFLLENVADMYEKVIVLFANTGQENEETLEFVDRCDKEFGFNVVWVEAVVDHKPRKGTKHRIVDFNSADRSGYVFEEMIKKYGIPNQSWPHCTRELKLQPMTSYLRSIGWKKGTYDIAIGIRSDEMDRMTPTYKQNNIMYPLISVNPMTKPDINTFWKDQKFRLQLKGYQGNCKWCWKKSFRKHFTIMGENPEFYEFPMRMEEQHAKAGYNEGGENERVFFRKNTSTQQLIELRDITDWKPADDDSVVYNDYLDATAGCSDSCEVDFSEM